MTLTKDDIKEMYSFGKSEPKYCVETSKVADELVSIIEQGKRDTNYTGHYGNTWKYKLQDLINILRGNGK